MAATCAGIRISFDEIHRILKQRLLSLFVRSIVEEDAFGVTRACEEIEEARIFIWEKVS